jgi:hypothetical protein
MRIYAITRLQWLVASVIIGALLAWFQTGFASGGFSQTHAPAVLETMLHRQPVRGEDGSVHPWVRSIRVYPANETGFAVLEEGQPVRPRVAAVRYQLLTTRSDGFEYIPATTLVREPFISSVQRQEYAGFADYLTALAADRDWIQFRQNWWKDARNAYYIWIGGSVLLIGIIWPTVLNRLARAGYGPPPEEIARHRNERMAWLKTFFTRAESRSSSAKPSPAATLTAADLQQIADMEERLRASGGLETAASGDATPGNKPGEVRKLDAAPLEQTEPEKPREEQDYDGEYWPTVAHAKKKTP